MSTTRYVWLNILDGRFSNSWDEEEHVRSGGTDKLISLGGYHKKWKLIKYQCLSDDSFEFKDHMQIG